jgi:hypothetical protein
VRDVSPGGAGEALSPPPPGAVPPLSLRLVGFLSSWLVASGGFVHPVFDPVVFVCCFSFVLLLFVGANRRFSGSDP